jgi:HNH endonuclease
VTIGERFWSKVDKDGPIAVGELRRCWIWTGSRGSGSYGQFRLSNPRRLVHAHRFAYELALGPIPDDLEVAHAFGNRACVNPAHLEQVDTRTRVLRGDSPSASQGGMGRPSGDALGVRSATGVGCGRGRIGIWVGRVMARGMRKASGSARRVGRGAWVIQRNEAVDPVVVHGRVDVVVDVVPDQAAGARGSGRGELDVWAGRRAVAGGGLVLAERDSRGVLASCTAGTVRRAPGEPERP